MLNKKNKLFNSNIGKITTILYSDTEATTSIKKTSRVAIILPSSTSAN